MVLNLLAMEREKLGSRLGFILLSAGCAIGIGNVYRFPYITGKDGGGAFVLFYLFFLFVMGIPIMTMEFAVGRSSRMSAIKSFKMLEKPGQKWHIHGYMSMLGNYCLMMFYTVIAGWMLYYFYLMVNGTFEYTTPKLVEAVYLDMLSKPITLSVLMMSVVIIGFGICSLGLQDGVERITKWMMGALLFIMVILAIHSISLDGGSEGLSFYLKPDLQKMKEVGIFQVIVDAMNQSFFTLSLGIGSMTIFGSYIGKEHSLLKESIHIAALDTFVAFVAGLIVFPACFSFNVNPGSGPSLIFITLSNVFGSMVGGRIWGSLFFIFMGFAAFSTVIAVFENLISCGMDQWGWTRKKACFINAVLIIILSMPCVLGFNIWSSFQPFGVGSNVLDLEDFIVSNLLLPGGSLVYLLFCVSKYGWGFDAYQQEANTGEGIKIPNWTRWYFTYVLPVILLFLLVKGVIDKFL